MAHAGDSRHPGGREGLEKGNLPLHTPAPAESSRRAPCSVGTPRRRRLPRDPVPDPAPQAPAWYRLRGGAGSGRALPQPPGCCLTDSLSIFEPRAPFQGDFAHVKLNQRTQEKILMRILQNKQEIPWMFSGTIGQHLPKESCEFVKVGFPLGSLRAQWEGQQKTASGNLKAAPKWAMALRPGHPGRGVSSVPPACSCLWLARIDPSLGTPIVPILLGS